MNWPIRGRVLELKGVTEREGVGGWVGECCLVVSSLELLLKQLGPGVVLIPSFRVKILAGEGYRMLQHPLTSLQSCLPWV